MALGMMSTGEKDPAGRLMGSIIASTRGKFCGRRTVTPQFSGIKYFGGGPVLRVPFAWCHLCFTINYLPSKEAVRSSKLRMKHGGERNYSEKSTSTGRWTLRSSPNTSQRWLPPSNRNLEWKSRWVGMLGTTYPSGDVNILIVELTSRE